MPEVKVKEANERGVRVFIGGCIERGDGSSFRRKAHAHNSKTDTNFGWICFRSAKRLFTASGNPSQILLEEIAHILAPNQGHNATWIRRYKELGAPLEKKLKVRLANARQVGKEKEMKRLKCPRCKQQTAWIEWTLDSGLKKRKCCPCGYKGQWH